MSVDDQLVAEEADLVNLTDDEFLAKHHKPKPKPKPTPSPKPSPSPTPVDDDTPVLNAVNNLTNIANQILAVLKGSPTPVPTPTPTPTPVPNPTPSPTPTPVPTPTPPGSGVDVFGITKIYADKVGTYNNWDMRDNTRWYEQSPKSLGNGWFTYPALTQGRIEVVPVAGLKDTQIDTYHMDTLVGRGYTHLPNNDPSGHGDWGGPDVGIEMTVRYRNVSLGSGSFEAHPETVWGTFRQSNGSPQDCQAGSYHSNIYYGTNRAHFEKDMRHTPGYTAHDPEVKGVVNINGQAEHVHKVVYYCAPNASVPGSGKQEVHMEQYLSTDGGITFKLLQKYVDNGSWVPLKTPGSGTACGYASDAQPISNAKCCPGWRIDFMKSFEFKDMSIRTIEPTQPLHAEFISNDIPQNEMVEDTTNYDIG